MKKNLLIVSALVLILLLIFRHRSGPAMDLHPNSALAEILAGEAGSVMGGEGKVVVIGRADDKGSETAGGHQILSFEAALNKSSSLKLVATEWLPPETSHMMRSGAITGDQLLGLIEQYPETQELVVFAGLPPLSPAITEKLKVHPVKLLAVCGYSLNTKAWLQAGYLAAAVVPRFTEIPPGSPDPKTTQEWFAREFVMLTPDAASEWPY